MPIPQFRRSSSAHWTITLPPTTPLLKMAVLMAYFRCHADVLENGLVQLSPFDPVGDGPTDAEFMHVLDSVHFGPLPHLRSIPTC